MATHRGASDADDGESEGAMQRLEMDGWVSRRIELSSVLPILALFSVPGTAHISHRPPFPINGPWVRTRGCQCTERVQHMRMIKVNIGEGGGPASHLHTRLDEVDRVHERVLSYPRARPGDHVAGIIHAIVLPDCERRDVQGSECDD